MNKHPKHHEIIRPIREIVRNVGEFVVDRVVPTAVIESLFTPPEATGGGQALDRHLYDIDVHGFRYEGEPDEIGE
jgi:hypothetical protein